MGPSIFKRIFFRLVGGIILALLTSSCSSLYFFYQAGKGQLSLLNRAKPVERVVSDPTTDPELAALLSRIPEIKNQIEQKGLKPTPNYREYVKLDRDAVVYVVTVCEPLQFKSKIFSFPIAGSFNYIGWFDRKDASDFAIQFEKEGMDIDVRGATAYSTLGWFKDPLLSSMIPRTDGKIDPDALAELVNVLIHESVHATIYLKDQSYFNESVAVFIADRLTRDYFESKGMLGSPVWVEYQKGRKESEKIRERMRTAYQDLKKVYDSSRPEEEKRSRKKAILDSLKLQTGLKREITNATLVQFQTYDDHRHGFEELYEQLQGDPRKFIEVLLSIRSEDFEKPHDENFDLNRITASRFRLPERSR